MKKRMLSILLAAMMVCSVLLPLANVATAASQPRLRMLHNNSGENAYLEMGLDEITYTGVKVTSVDTKNKTVFISFDSVQSDVFAFYFVMPNSDWTLFVGLKGVSRLPVKYNELTKSWVGLGTNGSMLVYAQIGGSALYVTGEYGKSKAAALNEDYYGLYGDSIAVGNNTDTLNLWVSFNLNTTGPSREVYPFKVTGKNCRASLNGVNFFYNVQTTYGFGNSESTPIELLFNTYLYTRCKTDNGTNVNPFRYLIYDNSFTGLVHIESDGYHIGGAYSSESNVAVLGQRHYAKIGNRHYYHAISKNCAFSLMHIEHSTLANAFSFPLEYGYTLPQVVEGPNFIAKVMWTAEGDDKTDLTGTKVEYDKKYTANITVIPVNFWYMSGKTQLNKDLYSASGTLKPANSYSRGMRDNNPYEPVIFFRYNPVVKPSLKITKQPVDYYGSGTDKAAKFSVDCNDATATYQWQTSNSASGPWTDITDKYTTGGGIIIGGAKAKNLTYNFTYSEVAADLKYFRCAVKSGVITVYSDIVKYEYKSAPLTPIHHDDLRYTVPMAGKKLVTPSYKNWLNTNFNVTEKWYKVTIKLSGGELQEVENLIVSGSTFTNGIYRVRFELTPKTGMYLADDFFLDVTNSFRPVGGYDIVYSSSKVTVKADYNVFDYLSKLTLGGNWAPVSGKTTNNSIPYPHAYDDSGNLIGMGSSNPTDKVVINRSKCFWYEGMATADPTPMTETDVFEDGHYYTYRFNVGPLTGYTFRDDIKFVHKDDPYDVTVTATKLSDGTYNVDFTYSRLASSITQIKLRYVDAVYGKKDYVKNEVRSMESDLYTVKSSLGWYETSFGTTPVTPQTGKTYYQTIVLTAADGYRFTSDISAIETYAFEDYYAKNEVKYDFADYKVSSVSRENDTLTISLGFNCTEARLYKCTVTDLDSPRANTLLDTKVTLGNPDSVFKFLEYTINGKRVDASKVKPAPGDIINAYLGVTAADGLVFDDAVQMYWTVDEGTANERNEKTYRDETYSTDPTVAVFTLYFEIPTDDTVIRNLTMVMKPPQADEEFDHGRWIWGYGLDNQEIAVFEDGEYISNYNYTAKAGQTYEIIGFVLPKGGYTIADDAVATWDVYGTSYTGKRVTPDGLTPGWYAFKFEYTVPDGFMLGDVDNDTKITASDARLALRRAVDLETYTPGSREFKACDVDKDGSVTANDARSILRAAVDLEDPATW